MRPNWLLMGVGIFLFGTVLMAITSGRWLVNGEINIINALASFENKSVGDIVAPNALMAFFNAIITAVGWHYPGTWLDEARNGWIMFLKFPLWLTSFAVIWALIDIGRYLVQGAITAIKSILS